MVTSVWPEFRFRQGGKTLAATGYSADFSRSVSGTNDTLDARILDGHSFFVKLLGHRVFTQDDLLQLAQSTIPEIRYGALAHLAPGAPLDAFALAEKSDQVLETIVRRLPLGEDALLQLTRDDRSLPVRVYAYTRILDNAILKLPPGTPPASMVPADLAGTTWFIREADDTRLSWASSWADPEYHSFFYVYHFKPDGSSVYQGNLAPEELPHQWNLKPQARGLRATWKLAGDTIHFTLTPHVTFEGQSFGDQMSGKITSKSPGKMKGNWVATRLPSSWY
jgi:hypothetical protein